MAYNLGSTVTISDFYSQNGYLTIDGVEPTGITDFTFYATESITFDGEILLDSDPYTQYTSDIIFEAPKIIINTVVEGRYYGVSIWNNGNNSLTFNNSSVNFDNAEYDTELDYIGPIAFTGTSSINVTSSTNGKTIIKASTLTGTVSLDVESGVQEGDTFLIDAEDNQLVITDGEWIATPSTSGNITTYTLSQAQPVPTTGFDFKKQLRRKLAIMLGSMKKKRPYYCEVEYLESTGTQYIDTGLNYFADFEIGIKLRNNVSNKALGNIGTNCMERSSSSSHTWRFTSGGSVYDSSINLLEYHVMKWKEGKIYADDTLLAEKEKVKGTGTMILFGAGYPYPNMIYFCKLWNPDNGELVRDFIPVLDWDMKPCMYDKVSGQLFYNQGTGSFTYGREIHYVDYLESDGTQYIDTGIKPNNNTSVELDYQLTQATQSRAGLFGALNMSGSNQGRVGSILSPTNSYLEHGYGSGNNYWQQGLPDTNRHLLYQKKNEVYFDGTLIHTFNTATFSLAINAYLGNFAYTNYTPAKAKYYGSRWWNNNEVVRDYKPAIDENGVCFWFDRVSHTIYDNAGTDVFKYPARETEYTGNDGTAAYIDLGAKYKPSMSIEGKYTRDTSGASGSVILVTTTTTAPLIYLPALSGTTTERFVWRRGGYNEQNFFINNITYPYTAEMVVDAVNDTLTLNGNVVKTGMIAGMNGYDSPYESSSNMYMFSIAGTYAGDGKVYYLKITDGTTPVFDLVPAYKDGSAGFYNKVDGTFFKNASTNASTYLVAGKIVEPEYE